MHHYSNINCLLNYIRLLSNIPAQQFCTPYETNILSDVVLFAVYQSTKHSLKTVYEKKKSSVNVNDAVVRIGYPRTDAPGDR
jgi:hypothetical protein